MTKILYVEDNELNRDMLSRRLSLEGYEVQLAVDGRQGVQMAKEHLPSLILMDLDLPILNGWDAIRELKAFGGTKKIPVIALSAHAMGDQLHKAKAAGADEVDTKPVKIERLLGIMSKCLKTESGSASDGEQVNQAESKPQEMNADSGRILVVDDNEQNVDLLSRRLNLEGYYTETAQDGHEALGLVDEREYDCVLLDVNMPGLNGYEVLQIIRKSFSSAELPVIIVTARDESSDVVLALESGANDFIAKPIDIKILLARLSTQVGALRLRKQLLLEKELHSGLIESAQEMIISTDRAGKIREMNRFAESTLSYRRDELSGQSLSLIFSDRNFGETLVKSGLAGKEQKEETALRTRRGKILPVRFSISPLRTVSGEANGVVFLAIDITLEKRAEEEQKRLARLREEFISIATHDMKNPLNSIMGFSGLLQIKLKPGDVLTEEACDFIVRIEKTSRILKSLVEDFLDYQVIRDGRLVLEKEKFDLSVLVRDSVDLMKVIADKRKISLKIKSGDQPILVVADQPRIRQVISNFLDNALKFTPDDGEILVSCIERDGRIHVEVADSGPGVPETSRDSIFQPWVISKAKPKGSEKSSGLGLSICAEIIKMHQGSCGVENRAEGGACFHFSLPCTGQQD